MATDPSSPDHWSADPSGRRHADVDEPLFDPDLIPNVGDPRSVGELLRDVDLQARQLLLDVTGDDAAGLLRGWPLVVDASAQLWHALPGQPTDPTRREDHDRPMTRLSVLSEAVADSLRSAAGPSARSIPALTRWPPPWPRSPNSCSGTEPHPNTSMYGATSKPPEPG